MDKKKMVKEALGRIKKLSLSATAARFKSRGEKKAPESEAPAPDELDEDPEEEAVESPMDEAEEDAEETDPAKKTVLITMTRAARPKASKAPEVPAKRKPGRPKKL